MTSHSERGCHPRRTHFEDVLQVVSHSAGRQVAAGSAGTIAVVQREGARTVLFQCPCGCGDMLVINVDSEAGRAWRLRIDRFGLTLMPSVWRTSGCKSHFILWRNQVWWCDWYDPDDEGREDEMSWPSDMDHELKAEWRRIRAAEEVDPQAERWRAP